MVEHMMERSPTQKVLLFLPTKVMNTSDDVTFSPGDGFAKNLVETEDNASIEVDDILKIIASVDNDATR